MQPAARLALLVIAAIAVASCSSSSSAAAAAASSWSMKQEHIFLESFFASSPQGVAMLFANSSVPEQIVFSGKTILRRCSYVGKTMTFASILENPNALANVSALGYNHIGDIDIYNGVLYAPIEEDSYTRPAIVTYDPMTLEYTGLVQTTQKHMPWVAVSSLYKFLFSSEFDNVTSLYVYQVENLKMGLFTILDLHLPVGLEQGLMAVQGGVVSGTNLYLSSSAPGDPVYVVDYRTGIVQLEFNLPSTQETEGIAIANSDGYMYVLVQNNFDVVAYQYSQSS
ncbi:hypothetical protein CAOG_05307 [Capsaspora owczarzaki ATCC 30864]|uniref:Uncharacterized protein n=1 Tax=Capsaspora owczarzaki (strain ATCC 30864) TaxID=595528 RepID=A0A0D2WRT1_CAPO3|nr:hypothetical protein CAOG_05307 [Capsaspora owczarzaki ATCC 30864]KJE94705.1 hypothetical protein CAOG_005307 [Capsaspora owczarzaki ATCC 30864]|eukprot:XP_004346992.1 hypothetical protein CAOG_05307 [Capsaspora owczarzaki ATCC 30864]